MTIAMAIGHLLFEGEPRASMALDQSTAQDSNIKGIPVLDRRT